MAAVARGIVKEALKTRWRGLLWECFFKMFSTFSFLVFLFVFFVSRRKKKQYVLLVFVCVCFFFMFLTSFLQYGSSVVVDRTGTLRRTLGHLSGRETVVACFLFWQGGGGG